MQSQIIKVLLQPPLQTSSVSAASAFSSRHFHPYREHVSLWQSDSWKDCLNKKAVFVVSVAVGSSNVRGELKMSLIRVSLFKSALHFSGLLHLVSQSVSLPSDIMALRSYAFTSVAANGRHWTTDFLPQLICFSVVPAHNARLVCRTRWRCNKAS